MEFKQEDALKLTEWYEKNHRDLPWRDTGDPYHVWISEIMLQQTRIEAVIIKYQIFVHELPDIASLAAVEDDRLMRLWEGLGYYSRARNLKKCAQVLVKDYDGKLPENYEELIRLPGIGPYTAGAIASIAYGKPVPAVDGNVLRILARLFLVEEDIRDAHTKAILEAALTPVYSSGRINAGSFNQGLMELGQLVCVPNGAPHCNECPLAENCPAYREKRTGDIPFRSKLNKRKYEERTLVILRDEKRFVIRKRKDAGLLAGLYEFPGIGKHCDAEELKQILAPYIPEIQRVRRLPDAKHIFSHIEWHMQAYEVLVDDIRSVSLPDSCIALTKEEMASAAIPSAFRTYIDYYRLRSY